MLYHVSWNDFPRGGFAEIEAESPSDARSIIRERKGLSPQAFITVLPVPEQQEEA